MEHREQLAKSAKQFFNKCKDSIRELRNRHVAQVKKSSEHHSADLVHSVEEQVRGIVELLRYTIARSTTETEISVVVNEGCRHLIDFSYLTRFMR
jgi:ribosome recycling factor